MRTESLQSLTKIDERSGKTYGQLLEAWYQSKSVPGGYGHVMGLFAEIYKSDFGADVCLHCAASAMEMINRMGYAWEQEKYLLDQPETNDITNDNRTPETINPGTTTLIRGVQQPPAAPLPAGRKKGGRPKGSGKK